MRSSWYLRPIVLQVPLLQIRVYCYKANRAEDIPLQNWKLSFAYFVIYSPRRKICQIKVVGLIESYALPCTNFLCDERRYMKFGLSFK